MFTASKQVSFSANAYVLKIYDFQMITFIYSSLTSLFIYELTKTHRRGSWAHIQCKADFYDTAYYIIIWMHMAADVTMMLHIVRTTKKILQYTLSVTQF